MKSAELREFLQQHALSQDEFARMVGASLRSVSSWVSEGGSDVPGPVEAYTRLFIQLPEYGRQVEILQARGQGGIMRDGVFFINYSSLGVPGWCTLTLDGGAAYGFDVAGGMYDGTYTFDATRGVANVELQVTIPPRVAVVWGPAKPYGWSFAVNAALNPNVDEGQLRLANALGPDVEVSYRFVRSLPARPVAQTPHSPSSKELLEAAMILQIMGGKNPPIA
jgi:hypothetical protein